MGLKETQLNKKNLQDLNNRIDIITELQSLNGSLIKWKGRLVIPVEKWDSLFSGNMRQALQYIPSGYTNIFEKTELFPRILEGLDSTEFEVWKEDYYAYLENIGDRVRGRKLCKGCLLEPTADTFLLRRILVRELIETGELRQPEEGNAKSNENHKETTQKQSPACMIHDRFNCPFRGSDHYNDDKLIDLGKTVNILESALSFAAEDGNLYDEPLDVDFQKEIVIIASQPSSPDHIKDLPTPRTVNVDRVVDVQRALADPDVLRNVLEQYLSNEMPHLNKKSFKDEIVSLLMKYKHKFRLEDLCDADGLSQEDSEDAYNRYIEGSKSRYWASGKCFNCGTSECQIRCSNCIIFMCLNHWQEHMSQKHPKTALRYYSLLK